MNVNAMVFAFLYFTDNETLQTENRSRQRSSCHYEVGSRSSNPWQPKDTRGCQGVWHLLCYPVRFCA